MKHKPLPIKRRNFDTRIINILFGQYRYNPYPTYDQKINLRRSTNLTLKQINKWLENARRRYNRKIQSLAEQHLVSGDF